MHGCGQHYLTCRGCGQHYLTCMGVANTIWHAWVWPTLSDMQGVWPTLSDMHGCGQHYLTCMGVANTIWHAWVWPTLSDMHGCGQHYLTCRGCGQHYLTCRGCGQHYLTCMGVANISWYRHTSWCIGVCLTHIDQLSWEMDNPRKSPSGCGLPSLCRRWRGSGCVRRWVSPD